jgi:glycosyltransferase involved in cell wall biosynthesis
MTISILRNSLSDSQLNIMPLVSICIPTYNQLGHFQNALNSALVQTFKDFEIIVTDDSSSDDIYEYINQIPNRDCIKYIRNNPSLGSPANWNKALSIASGRYIKILHHDDQFFDENSLGKFVEALNCNPSANIVFCSLLSCDVTTGVERIHQPSSINLLRLAEDPSILFSGNFLGPPSGVIFRAPSKYLFNEKLKWLVDIDFYIKNWTGKEFLFLPKTLVKITSGDPNQVTRNCEFDVKINLFEYFTVFDEIKNRLTKQQIRRCIRTLKIILVNLNVKSIEEIRMAGYAGKVPLSISRFISLVRINQTLAKCLARV